MRWPWSRPRLGAGLQERLDAWQALPMPDLGRPMDDVRWVVVDVESSGLNPHRDRLLSIGAVAVRSGRILYDDCFNVFLKQERPSETDNILVHGIGGSRQTSGVAGDEGLLSFLEYVGKSPLVAFHAAFDRVLIARAMDRTLRVRLPNRWLDLAELAPALFDDAGGLHTLDDWMERFRIRNPARHDAVADALATAELLLIALAAARGRRLSRSDALFDLVQACRWRARSSG